MSISKEMEKRRRVAILGSTGSIGRQALDVIRQHRELFEVELLTANNSAELLVRQAIEFDANNVVICNEEKYSEVADALQPKMIKVFAGMDSVCDLVKSDGIDIVLTSMVGFSGLRSTVAAIEAGKTIALANKETLVAAGSVVMKLAEKNRVAILPVDSEHSAIFQCLLGANRNPLAKIHLTASGGPFRTWEKSRIAGAKASDALKHPNWTMGSKITIDSATMMNKGLEFIEAMHLFSVTPDDIQVVIHPQSVIHSMVELVDGTVIAQLGVPDMGLPIQLALTYPERKASMFEHLDFAKLRDLTFEAPDLEKTPCLGLAMDCARTGGTAPCVMSAANEVAVGLFLQHKLGYNRIYDCAAAAVDALGSAQEADLETILAADAAARAFVREHCSK